MFISDIDEEELDWQLRTHQCHFDDSGPDVALPLRPNPPARHAVGPWLPVLRLAARFLRTAAPQNIDAT